MARNEGGKSVKQRIEVVNIRTHNKGSRANTIPFKIDRTTALGNPFFMANEEQRDQVCDDYEVWFYKKLNDNMRSGFKAEIQLMKAALKFGNNICLVCWCSPKRCHGDTIKQYLEDWLEEQHAKNT